MKRRSTPNQQRRTGETDPTKLIGKIQGVGKLSIRLLKQTLQAVAAGVASHFNGLVSIYARDVLGIQLIETAYAKDLALQRTQFKPEAAIRLAYTKDLRFGLRVVVYAEEPNLRSRMDFNAMSKQLNAPPAEIHDLLSQYISLAEGQKFECKIFSKPEGYIVQATKVSSHYGFKVYILSELAFALEGQTMFRSDS